MVRGSWRYIIPASNVASLSDNERRRTWQSCLAKQEQVRGVRETPSCLIFQVILFPFYWPSEVSDIKKVILEAKKIEKTKQTKTKKQKKRSLDQGDLFQELAP